MFDILSSVVNWLKFNVSVVDVWTFDWKIISSVGGGGELWVSLGAILFSVPEIKVG